MKKPTILKETPFKVNLAQPGNTLPIKTAFNDIKPMTETNSALVALMKTASRGGSKGRPEKILADQLTNPKAYRLQRNPTLKIESPIPKTIGQYEKIILDDQAIRLAIRLTNCKPIDLLKMLDVALPLSEKLWIEWPSRSMLEEQKKMQDEGLSFPATEHAWGITRPDWARCGALIQTLPEGYSIACVEHAEEEGLVYEWPVRFVIVKDSQQEVRAKNTSLEEHKFILKGTATPTQSAGVVWGYGSQTVGLSNLKHKGTIHIPSHMTLLIYGLSGGDHQHSKEIIINTTKELSGFPRIVVAILAMLHTSMHIDEPIRPRGQFMAKGGKPKPFSERRIARLLVPGRVRDLDNYVRKQIRDEGNRIRKRRHKVKAHFRHSHFLPLNGEGWVKCYCPGREPGKLWHKKIDSHWRGDESLGTIEHDYTLVSGPTTNRE